MSSLKEMPEIPFPVMSKGKRIIPYIQLGVKDELGEYDVWAFEVSVAF